MFSLFCNRFWATNIDERSATLQEALDAIDAWLAAGGIDDHDRPQVRPQTDCDRLLAMLKFRSVLQVLLRLRECFAREGATVTFGEFNRLTAAIIPFTPAKSVSCLVYRAY